jgi:ankyrin repeat protein
MNDPEITAALSKEKLWLQTVKALDGGDFSLLNELLTKTNASVIDLLEANGEPVEEMSEAFAWACFTGRTREAEILLDKGVDPAAGFKTGLAGFHWAANRGNLETVNMLIDRKAPLEQVNMYGGTVLGCAFYSAVFEHRDSHAAIIEALIAAGARIEDGTLEWWNAQDIPSAETKSRVVEILRRAS